MNSNGFLVDENNKPPKCDACNNPLGIRNPAENYLGTYTGLCYSCERAESYTVENYFDGAMNISYPPNCPSWRRDRREYIAFKDCSACGGTGRHYVSRPYPQGGPYYTTCWTCSNRYYDNPVRKDARDFENSLRGWISESVSDVIECFAKKDTTQR